MSRIKSFSVSNGDMFYIDHNADSFTIIDCNIVPEREDEIINELKSIRKQKSIFRFISTHPDEDHIKGIETIDKKIGIDNFYCVENQATKDDETESFKHYCKLRDGHNHFYLYKGVRRSYLNKEGNTEDGKKIDSAGINILWPNRNNEEFKNVLVNAKDGRDHNNISPIIQYNAGNGLKFLWLGDIENSFMKKVESELLEILSKVDVVFAPHHGRKSGKIPCDILKQLSPKLIVIGEADSEDLNYYSAYNHINQNTLKDILFEISDDGIDIYATNYDNYEFLSNLYKDDLDDLEYIGTITNE